MSEEKKELNVEGMDSKEMAELLKDMNKDSAWDGSFWTLLIVMMAFGGFGSCGNHDTTDHELRERVARLEGQMDMIRG